MARRRARWVTLTSDLGAAYAAQMKAVLARTIAPGRIIELTHDLRPHAIAEAGFVFRAMAAGFPPGTIHVAVVDPGVGGRRKPVAVACADGSALVGPDNGVLVPLAERLGPYRAVRIGVRSGGGPDRVGTTFDGRDLFAPAAARLARGAPVRSLGPPCRLRGSGWAEPTRLRSGARGTIAHVDHFGNLVTNIPTGWLPSSLARISVRLGRRSARWPVVRSYEALGPGRIGVLGSSFGTVEVAVALGRAADRLRRSAGDSITLGWPGRGDSHSIGK